MLRLTSFAFRRVFIVDAAKSSQRPTTTRSDAPNPVETGGAKPTGPRFKRPRYLLVAAALAITAIAVGAFLGRGWWLPQLQRLAAVAEPEVSQPAAESGCTDHSSPEPAGSLQLSEQAQKNIGLKLVKVEPRAFDRTINVPAMIVPRPGRTNIRVSAPMTGIVTRIHPIRGEAVTPGQPLFDLRLTHEDIVDLQSQFLRTVEQLDVIKQEVARLDEVTSSGLIAGKRLLERKYEQQMAKALLHSQQQALILHGLTESQVKDIASSRKLLRKVTVQAPPSSAGSVDEKADPLLQVTAMEIEQGQHVVAGEQLCTLTDNSGLYIEGKAFEEDSAALDKAAELGTPITARVGGNGVEGNGKGPHRVTDLKILYVENDIELESRALRFYVRLPNKLVRDQSDADNHRFIAWRYKPGQRVELLVPIERWTNSIVLPVEAIITEGAESFVFRQTGNRFERKPVHVKYSNQRWAVLENDGSLFPGDLVAANGAYQIHLALKNKAGGGIDPHAGHSH